MFKNYIIYSLLLLPILSVAQSEPCNLEKNELGNAYLVDAEDIRCLAKNSDKEISMFYTFAESCKPCLKHIPDLIPFVIENDLDLYIVLIDRENNFRVEWAEIILKRFEQEIREHYQEDFSFKLYVLKDEEGRPRKKYNKFLTEITPPQFEVIGDLGKHIVMNKSGEVLLVTSYKDNPENVEDKNSYILNEVIRPVLERSLVE
ncbi:MAG TPA: hypothetical protein VKX30_05530 [Flavobacteriaceae bacterium]|nr:hypothetical protein [Flavobacteriaceae bacterium]